MSRRKQLNPKPLKRADSDEVNDSPSLSPLDDASADGLEEAAKDIFAEEIPQDSCQLKDCTEVEGDCDTSCSFNAQLDPVTETDSKCENNQPFHRKGEQLPYAASEPLTSSANPWPCGQILPESPTALLVLPDTPAMLDGPPVCPKSEASSAKDTSSQGANDSEKKLRNVAAFPCTQHNGMVKAEPPSPRGGSPASPSNDNPSPPPSVVTGGFQCVPCGITFSNQRNLHAHQTLYCAYRFRANTSLSPELGEHGSWQGEPCPPLEPINPKREACEEEEDDTCSQYVSDGSTDDPASVNPSRSPLLSASLQGPSRKGIKSCRTYRCPRCPFTADRRSSLAKHTRMHEAELSPSLGACGGSGSKELCSPKDRYCASCNIQFMSYNTCQVHKLYYCSSRHGGAQKVATSPSPTTGVPQLTGDTSVVPVEDAETSSVGVVHGNPSSASTAYNAATNMLSAQTVFAAISTNPLILVPCSFVRGKGIVPTTGILPADAVMQMNGAFSPLHSSTASRHLSTGNPQLQSAIRHPPPLRPRPPVPHPSSGHLSLLTSVPSPTYIPQKCKEEPDIDKEGDDGIVTSKSEEDLMEPSGSIEDKPLDLSVKKKRDSSPTPHVEERIKKHSISSLPDDQASASLLPPSVDSSSPSSTSASCSSSSSTSAILDESGDSSTVSGQVVPQSSPPPPLVPITTTAGATTRMPISVPPSGPLVKQGNNICKECNIVFYKYDNYIAHKRHYCASRRSQLRLTLGVALSPNGLLSGEVTGSSSTVSLGTTTPSGSSLLVAPDRKRDALGTVNPNVTDSVTTTPHFRCVSCGVKFSSPDTLQAHQTYYCPRRDQVKQTPHHVPQRRQSIIKRTRRSHDVACATCKTTFPSTEALESHQCVVQWKCPYCDVICPTLTYAQHHLATHSDVRSFCCTVCGYRGNTLRGMRTHVRVHLDTKNNQTAPPSSSSTSSVPSLEETFIACVTEDGTITPLTPADKATSVDRPDDQCDIPVSLRRLSGDDRTSSASSPGVKLPSPHVGDARGTSPSVSSTTATFCEEEGMPDTSNSISGETLYRCECCGFSSASSDRVIQHVTTQHGEVVTYIPEESSDKDNGQLASEKGETEVGHCVETRLNHSMDAEDATQDEEPPPHTPPLAENDSEHFDSKDGDEVIGHSTSGSIKEVPVSNKRKHKEENEETEEGSDGKVAKTPKSEMSLHYLSKFIAHRKFYCVTSLSPTVNQETTQVQ